MTTNETAKGTTWSERDVSDFWRGYYEARGMVGHTYMSNHYEMRLPEWYSRESDEYKRGFGAGINSLARF